MSDIFGSPAKTAKSDQTNSRSTSATDSNSLSNSFNNSNSFSGNFAYPYIQAATQNQVLQGGNATNALAGLLGVGGDPAAQQSAFNNWKNSTGYQFGLDQGTNAITQNSAAKGLLNSGSTLKALNTFGQNYANTQFQNYLNPLQALVSSGNQAASNITNAGQTSNSSTTGGSNALANSTSRSDATSSGISLEDSRGANSGQGGQMIGQLLSAFAGGK